MHGLSRLRFYENLSTAELTDCVVRLTKELTNQPASQLVWQELEDISAEVDYRLKNIRRI